MSLKGFHYIVGVSLNCLSMSSIRIPLARLPLNCLTTSALSLSYLTLAGSLGLIACWNSSEIAPSMIPAAILSAARHSLSSSRYVFSSSLVGRRVIVTLGVGTGGVAADAAACC